MDYGNYNVTLLEIKQQEIVLPAILPAKMPADNSLYVAKKREKRAERAKGQSSFF
jgi:hypothetical protein